MLNRFLLTIKKQSKDTLCAWSYQCESILAQRSRRVVQLFTFYQHVYGTQGLKQLWRSYYRRQLRPPLHGLMLSAVGAIGLNIQECVKIEGFGEVDWVKERLSLRNFDVCQRDIEFINTLPRNKLCELCIAKKMKYCYCTLGNKKCSSTQAGAQPSIRSCHRNMELGSIGVPEGTQLIQAADESTWEPYFSKNQFSIWRREERTSMYAYKVYARFDDITANDLLHVQTDIGYRRQWDDTAVRLEVIEKDPTPNTNSHLIYWEMQWPRLFSNRDYVYCRRYITDEARNVILICNRGTKHPKYPIFANKVRVTDYWSLMVIKPFRNFNEPGLHFILTYYDDPGIPIPQNIKSWVTQKQMPDFLNKMYIATKEYTVQLKKMINRFHIIDSEYTANESRTSRWISKENDRSKKDAR